MTFNSCINDGITQQLEPQPNYLFDHAI